MGTRIAGIAVVAALFASAAAFAAAPDVAGQLTADGRHIVPPVQGDARLVINIPQRMLFFGAADGPFAFPIAVGRPTWQTPAGSFTILEKRTDPVWHVPPSILRESERLGRKQPPVVPPGPNNPLGKYWLGTSLSGIGIHGTNAPSSISRAVTHGCIRAPADGISRLFAAVDVGERGVVVYEPVLLAVVDGAIYLEVNADVYGRLRVPALDVVRSLAAAAGLTSQIDWKVAAAVTSAHQGLARLVTAVPAS